MHASALSTYVCCHSVTLLRAGTTPVPDLAAADGVGAASACVRRVCRRAGGLCRGRTGRGGRARSARAGGCGAAGSMAAERPAVSRAGAEHGGHAASAAAACPPTSSAASLPPTLRRDPAERPGCHSRRRRHAAAGHADVRAAPARRCHARLWVRWRRPWRARCGASAWSGRRCRRDAVLARRAAGCVRPRHGAPARRQELPAGRLRGAARRAAGWAARCSAATPPMSPTRLAFAGALAMHCALTEVLYAPASMYWLGREYCVIMRMHLSRCLPSVGALISTSALIM